MNKSAMHKILTAKHVQDVGRDLWQQFHDDNALCDLVEGVTMEIIKEISMDLYPEDDIPEIYEDFTGEHGESLVDFVRVIVDELLDVDALNREAEENMEELRERQEAAEGRY